MLKFTQPKIKSSLLLQILISIHPYYYAFYWLSTLSMLIYKGMAFQFLSYTYGLEVAALFPWIAIEAARLFIGSRGNKMEEIQPTAAYLCLTFLTIVVFIYYTLLQTYVLLFDIVIGVVAILLVALEFLGGVRLMLSLTGHLINYSSKKDAPTSTASPTTTAPPETSLLPALSPVSAQSPLTPSTPASS